MDPPQQQGKPLYADYGRLLAICAKHDVCISLGRRLQARRACRRTDRVQVQELVILGELVKRARENNVGVFVEGPATCRSTRWFRTFKSRKRCATARLFTWLGPLVTDVSPGYDHISAAIGGALAGMAGADFLCYVTPAEHLRLPSIDDVREGVVASRSRATRQTSPAPFPAPWNGQRNFPRKN